MTPGVRSVGVDLVFGIESPSSGVLLPLQKKAFVRANMRKSSGANGWMCANVRERSQIRACDQV